ncbi:hypothetical protein J18TS1_36990 [Oceanobacillus oncorhynchi subsp. incaldanensis]|uniref:DUF5839 family protein n=1 Tax=Oceanobacillus oncorhynchi TaxID=545501 RepID=UPI001B0F508E|nr:DUF5839 family protein [Oceanobacillus oncorhynchi]GIO20599.1 hypothetical protein J18TS1_36990 [Oceanobacillus oncorhynchi subsp. incaldanensis]
MKNNNTMAAFHILGTENGALKLNTNKMYHWNIPKRLRKDPIQKGDIVLVPTARGNRAVVVMNVFREEFEETQKLYKKVIKVIERAPQ